MRMIADKMRSLVEEASRWVGVREKGGKNSGPEVEMFQKAVDGIAQGEAWCMGFVFYCIKAVDRDVEGVDSWLFPTEHTLTCWNRSTMLARVQSLDVKPGDIVVWQHFTSAGKPTAQGHTGIVTRVVGPGKFETVEGNTLDGRAIVRDGDGVYRRMRDVAGSGNMRLKGFLRPWGVIPMS